MFETYQIIDEALELARAEGPVLLEAMTYRYVGHSMGDPQRYRTKAEIDEWRVRDPILRLAEKLQSKDIAAQPEFDQIHKAVEVELAEIVAYAEESPEPNDAALWEHIFVNPIGDRYEVMI